jgi:hypothetical protein
MGVERKMYKVFVGTPEEKRQLRRLMCQQENGIKKDLTENGWEGVEWIHLIQDRD